MSTIVTRAGKGSALTWTEGDANITNLNNDKMEKSAPVLAGNLDVATYSIITSTTNGNIVIEPNGTGDVHIITDALRLGDLNAEARISTYGTGNLVLTTNEGNDPDPSITIGNGANADITIAPTGTGSIILDGLKWPQTDGTAGYVLKTDGAGQLSWVAQSGGSSFDPASPGTIGGTTPGAATFSSVYVKGGVGTLRLYNSSGSNYTGLYGASDAAGNNYQLPSAFPSAANQALLADTSGVMSWGYQTIDLSNSPGPIGTAAGANAAKFTTLTFNTTRDIVYTSGSTTGTITPNAANGSVQKITLTGNITFNAFASPLSGQTLTLIITQSASGGLTLTSTMKFSGASKTLSTTANAVDIMTVFYDGTTYWASLAKGFA
jgi:hypothetical protein